MRKKNSKYKQASQLYVSGGFSIGDCADYYGITRQAMWKILKRRGVEMRPQLKRGQKNHFHRGGVRADKRAQRLVEKAILKGILTPEPCEECAKSPTVKNNRRQVLAHHDDYSKPLQVRWLCNQHHYQWHRKNKAIQAKG